MAPEAKNFKDEQIIEIKKIVGDKKVICGLSGGVDSSVVATLINEAIGKQLTCIFVDHGLLRKNEGEQVKEIFTKNFATKYSAKVRCIKCGFPSFNQVKTPTSSSY